MYRYYEDTIIIIMLKLMHVQKLTRGVQKHIPHTGIGVAGSPDLCLPQKILHASATNTAV